MKVFYFHQEATNNEIIKKHINDHTRPFKIHFNFMNSICSTSS